MSRRIGIANAHGCQHIFNNFGVRQREGASTRERESTDGESPVLRGGSGGASRYQYPLELTQTTQSGWGGGGRVATLVLVVVFARAVYYRPYSAASTASVWEI